MPVLNNPRHEQFAMNVALGASPSTAYIKAGFSRKGARQGAHKLLCNVDVSARMLEIRAHVSNQIMAGIIANGIADHNTRRWDIYLTQVTPRCSMACRGGFPPKSGRI
jgi:hypothetical protein